MKFEAFDSVVKQKNSSRSRTAHTNEIIACVSESIEEDPSTSFRRRSQQLNLSRSSLHEY